MRLAIVLTLITACIVSCNHSATANGTNRVLHKVSQEKVSTVKGIEFSPDGKYFLARGERIPIHVWQVKDFSLVKEYQLVEGGVTVFSPKESPHSIVGANFTPDSNSIYAGLDNGEAVIIALDSGHKTSYDFGKRSGIGSRSAISRSGKILALGGSYLNLANNKLTHTRSIADSGLVITQD